MSISLPYVRLRVINGSRRYNVRANQIAELIGATADGAESGHTVTLRVRIGGRVHAWTVRHVNRLADAEFNAHKGDPTSKVRFRPIRTGV